MSMSLKEHLRAAALVGITAMNGSVAYALFNRASEEIPPFEDTHYKTKANADCVIDEAYWMIGIKAEQDVGNINIAVDRDVIEECLEEKEAAYYQEKTNVRAGNYVVGSLGVVGALFGALGVAASFSPRKKSGEQTPGNDGGTEQAPMPPNPS